MTTVAVNKTGMAADGRACLASHIATNNAVKLREDEDYIYGGAGDFAALTEAFQFITAKREQNRIGFLSTTTTKAEEELPELDDDFHLVRLDKANGKAAMCTKDLVWIEVDLPFAIGSGAGFAIGAMAAGKTPKEAVKIAMKFDAATGGKITEIKR